MIAALLVLTGLGPRTVHAQEVNLFQVTHTGGYMELGVGHEGEEISGGGEGTSRAENLRFYEALGLDLEGAIYHPLFLRFKGEGVFEFNQGADEPLTTSKTLPGNQGLRSGSWNLYFFEQHPLSLSLYGRNHMASLERKFADNFRGDSSFYGGIFSIRKGPLPTSLSYEHSVQSGAGAFRVVDEGSDEWLISSNYEIGGSSKGLLEYKRTDEDILDRRRDTHDFWATHTTWLQGNRPKRFRGRFHYKDGHEEANGIERRDRLVLASTSLEWEHAPTFSSGYYIDFNRNELDGDFVDRWHLGTGLSHQLYGSLTSILRLEMNSETASFGKIRRYSVMISEAYNKRLGRWGTLRLSVTPSWLFETRDPRQEFGLVIDERVLLEGLAPVELRRREIDPTTIVVRDSSRSIIYSEGPDYTVTLRDQVVELRRNPFGSIPEGSELLVDYSYRLDEAGDSLQSSLNLSTSLSLPRGFELYAEYYDSEERRISGRLARPLEPHNRWTVGAWFSRGRFLAGIRYEDERESFTPQSVLSEELRISSLGWRAWRLQLAASHRYVKYSKTDESASRLYFSGRIMRRFSRWASLEIKGEHEQESWSGIDATVRNRQDINRTEISALFSLDFRAIRVELEAEFARLEQNGIQRNEEQIFLLLRREF
jgi:hypothetical protein